MPRNGSGVYSLPPGSTFTPVTLAQSGVVNSINQDIAADLNTPRPIVAGGTGATTIAEAQAALGLSTGTFGFLYGMTLSNNVGDQTNSIDIAVGTAAEEGVSSPQLISLPAIISKSVAAAWTVGGVPGSPVGGLDTGAVANGTYHVWLIHRSDTGVVDALFSLSATSPTMPAGYDSKRRIGSILREAGANVLFTQIGDNFYRAKVADVNAINPTPIALLTLSVPTGIVVRPKMSLRLVLDQSTTGQVILGHGFDGGNNTEIVMDARTVAGITAGAATMLDGDFVTNTSAQIYHGRAVTVGTAFNTFTLNTMGWIDTRGRI